MDYKPTDDTVDIWLGGKTFLEAEKNMLRIRNRPFSIYVRFPRKTKISYPLICTQGVRHFSFLEDFAYLNGWSPRIQLEMMGFVANGLLQSKSPNLCQGICEKLFSIAQSHLKMKKFKQTTSFHAQSVQIL